MRYAQEDNRSAFFRNVMTVLPSFLSLRRLSGGLQVAGEQSGDGFQGKHDGFGKTAA